MAELAAGFSPITFAIDRTRDPECAGALESPTRNAHPPQRGATRLSKVAVVDIRFLPPGMEPNSGKGRGPFV
jgi:hypothetical protein